MMTIKEMSELSGVSARTLRYYDEIGLFHPTGKSEAGYRLYDDDALEALRYILYFREMDIPLSTIKEIISNPALDKNHILEMQKKMLEAERDRINRLYYSNLAGSCNTIIIRCFYRDCSFSDIDAFNCTII